MDFEQSLTAELSAVSGLASKVFSNKAQQDIAAPYLVYFLSKEEGVKTLAGYTSLVNSEYQIDLYHSSYGALKALKKLVIQALKLFEMLVIGTSGPFVQSITIMNSFETYESAIRLHKGIIEFSVSYNE